MSQLIFNLTNLLALALVCIGSIMHYGVDIGLIITGTILMATNIGTLIIGIKLN